MLYQLSYEATDVGNRSIVGSYVPVKEMSVLDGYARKTICPSILQSPSRYKAKPLCDGPLVPVLLRLAQRHQHLLVKNIKCHKIYKKLCIRTGFVKICAKTIR